VLTSFKGTDNKDLIFNNVTVIKGFHVNIVLKALITKLELSIIGLITHFTTVI